MRIVAALVLALAGCAGPAPERHQSAAAAFAPLMGCWRGAFADAPGIVDERCFEPLGEHVVDIHHVRPTSYGGETTYHYDEAADEIVWAYAANDGGRSNGSIRREGERFIVAAHTHYGASGESYRLRSVWTIQTRDRFVMETEREQAGLWSPFARISFERAE